MADVWSVYKHTCPNGKVYIGITSRNCEDRWRNGHGYRNNKHFFSAIKEYGWDNIKHEIIVTGICEESAKVAEQFLITIYESTNPLHGYNHSNGGEGKSGFVPTSETRAKIRKKLLGTHRPDEVRVKLSVAHSGKRLSDEHKTKIKMSCKNINAKAVLCLTSGKVYVSATEASRQTGISRSGITACCRGEIPACKMTVWAYLEGGVSVGK